MPEGVDEGVEAGERVQLELRRRLLQHRQQRARRAHHHRRRRHVRRLLGLRFRSAAAGVLGCAAARFLLVRRRLDFGWVGGRVRFAAGVWLAAEEDRGFAGEERSGGPGANIWDRGGAIPKSAGGW